MFEDGQAIRSAGGGSDTKQGEVIFQPIVSEKLSVVHWVELRLHKRRRYERFEAMALEFTHWGCRPEATGHQRWRLCLG